jgi:hypothetical protein
MRQVEDGKERASECFCFKQGSTERESRRKGRESQEEEEEEEEEEEMPRDIAGSVPRFFLRWANRINCQDFQASRQ